MAALPYMQFHIAEYLADTSHLSTEEHGAYLLLIFNYWQRGKALDNANGRLANVVRLSNERWADVASVLKEFFVVDGDVWTHHRIERDLEAVNAKCEQARNARSQRKKYGRSTSVATDVDTDAYTDDQRNHNDKSINRIEEIIKDKDIKPNIMRVYDTYPHKVGKGAAVKAIEKAFDSLRKRNESDPEKFLIERIQGWIAKREKDRAAGKFVPEYPNPATWFNQSRYDDEDNLPKPKKEWRPSTQRELDEQNYKDFGSPPPEEWAPEGVPQGWVPCRN